MRLVLIHPNYHSGGAEIAGNWPPAWVAYLVGALRNAGYDDIRFIDAMTNHIEDAELAKLLEDEDAPDMIMSTCITPSIYQAQRTLEMAKEIHPEAVTVLGGVHATFMYQQVLSEAPWIDFIVRGEGEEILCNLVRSVEAGTIETDRHTMKGLAFLHEGQAVATPAHPPIQDLDSLTPDWSILEWDKYIYIPLNTRVAIPNFARGCPFTCSFCSQWKFWRTYRSRSPKNFVDEIEMLVKEHDVGFFILADEEPTIARKKFVALCEELIERDLGITWGINTRVTDILRDEDLLPLYRKAGLVHVSLGTEASAQLNLERFRKETTIEQNKKAVRLLKENGIVAEAQFIIGLENETPETIEDTYKWALDWDADMVNWNMYTPWPFSDLFKELGDKVEVHDYAKYNFVTPIMKPDMMERGEVLQAVMKNYRRFYMRKSFLGYPWIKDSYKRKYMMGCLKAFAKSTLERRFYDLGRINFWGQKDVDFGFDPSRIKGADADRGTAGTQANGNGHGPLVQLTDNRGGRDEFNDPELPQQDAAPAGLACGGGNGAPAEYIDPGDMKIRPVFTEPKMDEFSNPREWARKQARARAVSRGLIPEDALAEDIDAAGAEAEAELQGD